MMLSQALKIQDRVLIPKCWVADSFWSRLIGLMGKKNISAEEAILFPRCNSVQTCFMRFPIDVLFVDKDGEVVDVKERLLPWRFTFPRKRVKHAIEMRAGLAKELGIKKGTKLHFAGVGA